MRKLVSSYPTAGDLIRVAVIGCLLFCLGLMTTPLVLGALGSGKCLSIFVIFGSDRVVYRTVAPIEFWCNIGLGMLGFSSFFCLGILAPVDTILKYKARKAREKLEAHASMLPKTD